MLCFIQGRIINTYSRDYGCTYNSVIQKQQILLLTIFSAWPGGGILKKPLSQAIQTSLRFTDMAKP